MDFEKPTVIRTEEHTEKVAAAVAAAFPQAPQPRVIPSSLLIRELGRLADRGELPKVGTRFELFTDGGHLGAFGQYADIVMVNAMLYNESPLAYPADVCTKTKDGAESRGIWKSLTIPPERAEVMKRVVWDILLTYPPGGMDGGLVVAQRRLAPAIAGQPYQAELTALHAAGPCTWSVAKGTLPKGIALSAAGVLAGQATAPGEYPVTIKVGDGKGTFERPVVLAVDADRPPVIPDQPLPGAPLDQYIFQPRKVAGGVGHITWSVVDGKLDEPFWDLDQPIAKKVKGAPVKKASFGAVWSLRDDKNKEIGGAVVLAVKVLDGGRGKTAADGVHFFIDGRHNKEVIYNADDTHFFVPRDQQGDWAIGAIPPRFFTARSPNWNVEEDPRRRSRKSMPRHRAGSDPGYF